MTEPQSVRDFVTEALTRQEAAQQLVDQQPPQLREYARGLSDGMQEACRQILAHIDRTEQ